MLVKTRPLPETLAASIAGLPIAAALPRSGRRQIEAICTINELSSGQVLANEGEVGQDFLIVAEGFLKLWKALPDGRQQIVAFRSAGDLVSLHRCDTPWPVTAEAMAPSKVYALDWHALRRLAASYSVIDQILIDVAADEIACLQDRLLTLGRRTIEEKVALFLLELCRPSALGSPWCRELHLPMRRPEIADYLGLTAESVCRELSRLKREKIVAMPRPSYVILLNRPALEALASGVGRKSAGVRRPKALQGAPSGLLTGT